jgi:hypothetical protein
VLTTAADPPGVVPRTVVFPTAFKDIELLDPEVSWTVREIGDAESQDDDDGSQGAGIDAPPDIISLEIMLSASAVALFVALDLPGASRGRFSDQGFHLLPGESRPVTYRFAPPEGLASDAAAWAAEALEVTTLYDSYME